MYFKMELIGYRMKNKASLCYKLRELTDESLSKCKSALVDSDWDFLKAIELLKERRHRFYTNNGI